MESIFLKSENFIQILEKLSKNLTIFFFENEVKQDVLELAENVEDVNILKEKFISQHKEVI